MEYLDAAMLEMLIAEGVLIDHDAALRVAAANGDLAEFDAICDLADDARFWVGNAYAEYRDALEANI